jgi:hypothetical protein
VLVLALLVVAGAVTVASFAVRPSKARAFDLFYGSLFIDDNTAPVAVDLASGKPSIRLTNAYTQVAAKASGDLDVVPLDGNSGGTLLLDSATGEFNMLDATGFVLKTSAGGVSLPNASATTSATAVAAGDAAYIVRSSDTGTSVYLVNQSTVSAAAGGANAQARASVSMSQQVAGSVTTTAAAANSSGNPTANSDLWLLVGSAPNTTIRQLHVPAGSNAGATLDVRDHGTVSGVAAVGVSSRNADGTGGDVVAVASQRGIDVFDGPNRAGRVTGALPSNVDTILPTSDQQGSFVFLYHSPTGWSLVRAAVDAKGPATVTPLPAITGTDLAPPAQSSGSIFTMDRRSGALWQISATGHVAPVPTQSTYPRVPGETTALDQASVIARGSRVIFNSRSNLLALTVFADGSHQPVTIDKRTAVDLNSNGAAALANLQARQTAQPNPSSAPPQNKPAPNPAEPVTDKIDCSNTTQIPHIPAVQLVSRGSRSVQIQWTYPLLDRQDCAPSTYTVSVGLAGGDAPKPPGMMTVQGVTGLNITGLFPDTQYKIVVTAYINGKHTASAPLQVRTQVEGPAAPTNLRVSADDQGDWTLSWNSCGGIQQGCVPVTSWTIIPQLCQSSGGLIGAPQNGNLVADPTTHSFTYTYRGGPALLGYGLSFAVEGIGDAGTIGDPTVNNDCVHSWAHPVASNIHVAASTPAHTSHGGTSSTTVNVTFDGDPNVALGGVGGQLTYRLLSGGSLVEQKGPTSATTVSLPGIQSGSAYQVQVIVAPPGHPTASVALPPVNVQAAIADWPNLTVSAAFTPNPPSTGALTVNINGLTSADARGETFDLVNSQLVCGNTALQLAQSDFNPATPLTFGHIDRSVFNGGCTVRVALQEDAATVRSPAYFGGTASPAAQSAAFTIPVPTLDTSATQFTANFVSGGFLAPPQIAVSYTGSNNLLASYATNWSLTPIANGTACPSAGSTGNPAAAPVTISLGSCYYQNQGATWQVAITFTYFGQSPSSAYQINVSGTGPPPMDPAKVGTFAATFTPGSGGTNGTISLTYTPPSGDAYTDAQLAQLTWSENVTNDNGTACGSGSQPASSSTPITLIVDTTACPPTSTTTPGPPSGAPGSGAPSGAGPTPVVTPTKYTVTITFTDPNYTNDSSQRTATASGS